jgi:hypothetical protein
LFCISKPPRRESGDRQRGQHLPGTVKDVEVDEALGPGVAFKAVAVGVLSEQERYAGEKVCLADLQKVIAVGVLQVQRPEHFGGIQDGFEFVAGLQRVQEGVQEDTGIFKA